MEFDHKSLIKELRENADFFNPILFDFVAQKINDKDLYKAIIYGLNTIGNRERSLLVKIVSDYCNRSLAKVLPIALASELFIATGLIGDDFLDRADIRWGKKTTWAKYGDRNVFLISEILHALANLALNQILLSTYSSFRKKVAVLERFSILFNNFYSAQYLDISCERKPFDRDLCIKLALDRTGALIRDTIVSTAILHEANPSTLRCLDEYGANMGIAFQLRDDVLDIIGEKRYIGKPVFGDILNGQPNIVVAYAFELCEKREIDFIKSLYGHKRLTEKQEGEVLEILLKSGSIDSSINLIENYVDKSLSRLKNNSSKAASKLRLFSKFLHKTLLPD